MTNVVTISGNLVADPDLRFTDKGVPLCRFRLANTERKRDASTGEWRDGDTLFISVTCWRWVAEHAAASLTRGSGVVITGRLESRSYEKDGVMHTVVEIAAADVAADLSRATVHIKRAERTADRRPPTDAFATPVDGAGAADGPVHADDAASATREAAVAGATDVVGASR